MEFILSSKNYLNFDEYRIRDLTIYWFMIIIGLNAGKG